MNYWEYIKSDKWAAKRAKIFERDGYQCTMCPSRNELRCHHKTYERLGHERDDDLTTLCARCHNDIFFFEGAKEYEPEHIVTEAEYKAKCKAVILNETEEVPF